MCISEQILNFIKGAPWLWNPQTDFDRQTINTKVYKTKMNKRIAALYKTDLDLLRASKIKDDVELDRVIDILTLTAHEDMSCSQEIVDVIRDQIKIVSTQTQILIVALVFAIVSSVGMEYKKIFDNYIVEIFMTAFVRADSAGRMKLFEMRDKWDFYFSNEALHELDCAAKKVDLNWPIFPVRPERFEMNEKNMALQAEIRRLDEEKRILSAKIEKLEREAIEAKMEMEPLKIIKQNPFKRQRRDQEAEFKSKWNGYQPSAPSDVKIDFSMDSQEDPFSLVFAPAAKRFCKSTQQVSGIITPPPEKYNAEKPTTTAIDNSSFWMKTKSLTEKSSSLFFGKNSEFVI